MDANLGVTINQNFPISDNQIIYISRGQYLSFPVYINSFDDDFQLIPYHLQEYDKLYFYVLYPKQDYDDTQHTPLIKKEYGQPEGEDEDVTVTITSAETNALRPGTYYYEIRLVQAKGQPEERTEVLMPKRKFIVME